jgi:uncharacterized protein (DUF2147 family)
MNGGTVKTTIAVLAAFLAISFVSSAAHAQPSRSGADAVLGTWTTAEGKSKVEVYSCEGGYCAKIIWIRDSLKNGRPVADDKNPDETLRNRPVLGLEIMKGFEYDGDAVWKRGKIYDPESGNLYSAKMTLVNDSTLELRGYVLVPLFGRTETWTR